MIQTSTKANFLLKVSLGYGHTSNEKETFDESEKSSFILSAQNIFGEKIYYPPSDSKNIGIVSEKVTLNLIPDPSLNKTPPDAFLTILGSTIPFSLVGKINPKTKQVFQPYDRVGFIIPTFYNVSPLINKETYSPKLYNNGILVDTLDGADWFLDPFSGIVAQEGDTDMFNLGNNGTLECYIYVGKFLSDVLTTSISGSGQLSGITSQIDTLNSEVLSLTNLVNTKSNFSTVRSISGNLYSTIQSVSGNLSDRIDSIQSSISDPILSIISNLGTLYATNTKVHGISATLQSEINSGINSLTSNINTRAPYSYVNQISGQLFIRLGELDSTIRSQTNNTLIKSISGKLQGEIDYVASQFADLPLLEANINSLENTILDCLSEMIMTKNAPKPIKASYLIKANAHLEIMSLKFRLFLEFRSTISL